MKLKISHRTVYRYEGQVPYALQQVRLEPQSCNGQTVISWKVITENATQEVNFIDQYGNRVILVSFDSSDQKVSVLCEGEVETTDIAGIIGPHSGMTPLWYFLRSTKMTESGSAVRKLIEGMRDAFPNDVDLLHALSERIVETVAYETGHTVSDTTAEGALALGKGVCQDHAHIFISAARLLGFPARYVSGYLMMESVESQEASHAWAEAHVPELGWVGIDVSNRISPDEKYVRIATGLDYTEAAPISGITFGDHSETMSVKLQVQQ